MRLAMVSIIPIGSGELVLREDVPKLRAGAKLGDVGGECRVKMCFLLLIVLGLAEQATGAELQRFAASRPEMGVEFEVIVYAAEEAAAMKGIEAAFARIAEL